MCVLCYVPVCVCVCVYVHTGIFTFVCVCVCARAACVAVCLTLRSPRHSTKFSNKIKYVNSLDELRELIPMEYVHIPECIIR